MSYTLLLEQAASQLEAWAALHQTKDPCWEAPAGNDRLIRSLRSALASAKADFISTEPVRAPEPEVEAHIGIELMADAMVRLAAQKDLACVVGLYDTKAYVGAYSKNLPTESAITLLDSMRRHFISHAVSEIQTTGRKN